MPAVNTFESLADKWGEAKALDKLLATLLVRYKSYTDPLTLIFLVENIDAMRVLAAWPYVRRHYDYDVAQQLHDLPEPVSASDVDWQWELMFTAAAAEMGDIARTSGLTLERAGEVYRMLKTARLIYPDGAVNEQAKKVVSTYIMGKISKKGAK